MDLARNFHGISFELIKKKALEAMFSNEVFL